jgi:hypothetical protein
MKSGGSILITIDVKLGIAILPGVNPIKHNFSDFSDFCY